MENKNPQCCKQDMVFIKKTAMLNIFKCPKCGMMLYQSKYPLEELEIKFGLDIN